MAYIPLEDRIYNQAYGVLNAFAVLATCAGLFALSRLFVVSVRVLLGAPIALFHGAALASLSFGVLAVITGLFLYSMATKWSLVLAKLISRGRRA